jgi:GxxExxY protein
MDVVVDGVVALEIKAHYDDSALAFRQLQTYLRATRLRVGLVLQFGRRATYFRVYNADGERA